MTGKNRFARQKNKYGVETGQVREKLKKLCNNLMDYKPHELARDLVKLAASVDEQITITTAQQVEMEIVERENNKQRPPNDK